MFCQYCGNQIKDDVFFCNKCGKKLNESVSTQSQTNRQSLNADVVQTNTAAASSNKSKKFFLGANEREHNLKLLVVALFAASALMWFVFLITLMSTKLGIIADFIEIAEHSFLDKERVVGDLRKLYDISPMFFMLVSFAVIVNIFVKGISLYSKCRKRDFRKNKRNVVINSAIDTAEVIIGVFISWQVIERCIGFRDETSLSTAFYVLFLFFVFMEIMYDWCFIKAADCEAESLYQVSVPVGEWKCKHCGTANTKKDLFCKSCGANFEKTGWTCTSCGLLNQNGDLSCKGCGKYK